MFWSKLFIVAVHCLSSFHSAKEKCLPSSDEERKKDILHLLINQFFPMRLSEVTSEYGVLFGIQQTKVKIKNSKTV